MRALVCLLVSVFLLMFGYNAVEAAYPLHAYDQATKVLSVLYLVLTLSNIPAGFLTSVKPAGTLIIFGPIGYFIFTCSLLLDNFLLALIASIIIGFTSAIYWICCRTIVYREVEERKWGCAFGLINIAAVLAGGLGPYILLKLSYEDLLKISSGLCLLSILPLLPLYGTSGAKKEEILTLSSIKNCLNRKLVLYSVTAFCFSVNLPILIAYIPAIGKDIVGEYRLLSYAIPSMFSLLGGFLYDRFGVVVIPISALLALIAFLNLPHNIITWGFILTASFSILFPGFQAFLGRIVGEDKIPIALGFVGLIAGVGVSLNIAVIGVLLSLAWLYLASLMVLGIVLSAYLLRVS